MIAFVLRDNDGYYFTGDSPDSFGIITPDRDPEISQAKVFRIQLMKKLVVNRYEFRLVPDPELPECIEGYELVAIKIGEL